MKNFKFNYDSIQGYLIDMDGVIYKSKEVIPGAVKFIELLQKSNTPFLFLTNNSQRSPRDISKKLSYMKIHVKEENILTCAQATARFLASQENKGTVYVIGEGGLHQALYEEGFAIDEAHPEFVIIGEGRTANMEMIDHCVDLVYKGAKLISTNPDYSCPTSIGLRSGCGAIVSLIEKATGKKSFSIGKPNPIILREARREINLPLDSLTMVGDTMETDILGAVQMGIQSILVLSGGTHSSQIGSFAYSPGKVVSSIEDLISLEQGRQNKLMVENTVKN
jgi:NagD protein